MPSTPDAVAAFQDAGVLFGPGKAANAGGVATSALEMSQNAARQRWSFADSEAKLRSIMQGVHDSAFEAAERYGRPGDYVVGCELGRLRARRARDARAGRHLTRADASAGACASATFVDRPQLIDQLPDPRDEVGIRRRARRPPSAAAPRRASPPASSFAAG